MRMTTLAAGVLAALGAGALTLLVAGPIAAIAVLILAVAAVVGAMRLDAMYLRWAAGLFVAVLVVSIVVAVWATLTASNAVAGTSGPVDEPDPIALGAFDAQADVARTGSAFRLEVTEDQLSAGLQRSLADLADNPFSAISLDVLNPRREGAQGTIEFTAEFKDSGIEYTGEVALEIIDGKVHADVEHGKVGMLRVPCLVCGDYVDAIESAFNMDRILGGINGEYIALGVGANQVVLIGNHPSGGFVMPDALVTTINTEVLRTGLGSPPSETRPPGTIDGPEAPGDRYYVALGDSLSMGAGAQVHRGSGLPPAAGTERAGRDGLRVPQLRQGRGDLGRDDPQRATRRRPRLHAGQRRRLRVAHDRIGRTVRPPHLAGLHQRDRRRQLPAAAGQHVRRLPRQPRADRCGGDRSGCQRRGGAGGAVQPLQPRPVRVRYDEAAGA
jgi:hypothetical protein